MPDKPQSAPFSTFRFRVRFTSDTNAALGDRTRISDMGFAEVTGLEANVDVKAHPEGGRALGTRQLLGRTTHPNLVLKRGMSSNFETFRWFTAVSTGVRPVPRKDVTIELCANHDLTSVVARWRAVRAVPVKLRASDLNAKTGEIAIEELHLAHEGLSFDLTLGGS